MLNRVRRDSVGLAAVVDQEVRGHRENARGRMDDVTDIAEAVAIDVGGNRRVQIYPVSGNEVGGARGMHAEHQDHRCRLRTLIGNFIPGANLHQTAPWRAPRTFADAGSTSALTLLLLENSVTRPS